MREADEGREPPHSAPPAALVAGSVVASRYEILGLVGEGGMGVVYRARDRSLDEVVAIKVLRPQLVGSPQMAQRFRAEIKLARRVTHRNVCRIHDYGEDGSLAFISMELVEGVDLKRLVREQRDLSPDETFDIALQLADGLQAIHDEGIIHRDFKTANVMIDRRGTVRLMDFGIAKLWEAESAEGLTLQGQTAGTPEYMSPEQASGQALDPRSDIYSLGVVLFELFTGIRPFAADHVAAVIYKQVHEEPPWSAPRASALPPALQAVIRRALAKRREDRFASAADVRRALEQERTGAPVDVTAATETLVLRVKALEPAPVAAPTASAPRDVPSAGQPPVAPAARVRSRTPIPAWAVLVGIGVLLTMTLAIADRVWRAMSEAGSSAPPATGRSPAGRSDPPAPVQDLPASRPSQAGTAPAETLAPKKDGAAPDTSEQRLCDGGSLDACVALAERLEAGSSLARDPARAAGLYRKACDGGAARACTQLGVLFNRGDGVPRDLPLAAVQYDRGCTAGDMAGCSNLGTLYQFGMAGVRGDPAKAGALYDRACSSGHMEGCANLGLLYLDDSAATAGQRARASTLLRKACDAGIERACQRLRRGG